MIKLINILKEVVLRPIPIFPERLEDALRTAIGDYTAGASDPSNISEPYEETFKIKNDINWQEVDKAIELILKELSEGTYLGPELLGFGSIGAPASAYFSRIIIHDNKITVQSPHPDTDYEYYTGWFDTGGKFHVDTENFDENGNKIN
jgi:hypothetical protein